MTYRWLTDLDEALASAGVPFVEVLSHGADPTGASSWRDRGRPYSTGDFDPTGVLCHHTASPVGTSDETDLRCILAGNSNAPGPISSVLIGRSCTVYLVAAGRCNHGGGGMRPGIDSDCTDMNACTLGIEVSKQELANAGRISYARRTGVSVSALCAHYGWSVMDDVWLHATTGPPYGGCNSKIDPAGPWTMEPDLVGSTTWNLDTWRTFCAAGVPGTGAPVPTHKEGRRTAMADFVVVYGLQDAGVPDGSVYELISGRKRHVGADEWHQVLKGVVAGPDGVVPPHDAWQPVAAFTNGWYAVSLPDYDSATSAQMAEVDLSRAPSG